MTGIADPTGASYLRVQGRRWVRLLSLALLIGALLLLMSVFWVDAGFTPREDGVHPSGGVPQVDPTPYYFLAPQTMTMAPGDTSNMVIRTSQVEGLGGVSVYLRWDPAILEVVDASSVLAGVQIAPGDVFTGMNSYRPSGGNNADNGAGELTYALSLIGTTTGVSGEFSVATIAFRALQEGTTAIEFYGDTLMANPATGDIVSGWQDGQVTVSGGVTPTITVEPTTPAATPTPTATEGPTPVIVCREFIQEGGFEAGGSAWQTTGNTTYDGTPHTGTYSAWLGGLDNADDSTYQQVTIPATAQSADLSYWWKIYSTEPDHPYDFFYAAIHSTSGALLETLDTRSDAHSGDWAKAEFDLSAYAGQTIRVTFSATTDQSNYTNFWVDDVSLYACYEQSSSSGDMLIPLVMRNYTK